MDSLQQTDIYTAISEFHRHRILQASYVLLTMKMQRQRKQIQVLTERVGYLKNSLVRVSRERDAFKVGNVKVLIEQIRKMKDVIKYADELAKSWEDGADEIEIRVRLGLYRHASNRL